MTSYTLHLDCLLADPQQGATLILHTLETPAKLRVRVCGADEEPAPPPPAFAAFFNALDAE